MMKPKLLAAVFALMLCVGAFLIPMTAYAAEAPTVSAWLNGDTLRIEAEDAGSGVEYISVDGRRINYRVDGAAEVNARDYHGNREKISVYAVNFAGVRSNVIEIANPYYKAPAVSPAPKGTTPKPDPVPAQPPKAQTPAATPSPAPEVTPAPKPEPEPAPEAVPEQEPFTPDGQATVVDNVLEQNGKEFFTITTPDENVFYLVIDRQRDSENVYLLNAVTEADLMMLAEEAEGGGSQSVIPEPEPEVTPAPEPEPPQEPAEPEEPAEQGTGAGSVIFILLAVLAAGGAGYYFKVYKPKRQAAAPEDEYDGGEDMEYEDPRDQYGAPDGYPDEYGDYGDYEEREETAGEEEYAPDGTEPGDEPDSGPEKKNGMQA